MSHNDYRHQQPDNNSPNQIIRLPASFFLRFFTETTRELHQPNENHDKIITLEDHQKSILDIQRRVLERLVAAHNDEFLLQQQQQPLTVEQAQEYLRCLGKDDEMENIILPTAAADDDSANEFESIRIAMQEMNDAARLAFARSVLRSEWKADRGKKWLLRRGTDHANTIGREEDVTFFERMQHRHPKRNSGLSSKKKKKSMERLAILEFCGLCIASVRLPEVKEYLMSGKGILEGGGGGNESYEEGDWVGGKTAEGGQVDTEEEEEERMTTPKSRIMFLQNLFYRAVGYDPEFGASEMHRQIVQNNLYKDDKELMDTFNEYVSAMSVAVTNATLAANGKVVDGTFSDVDKGGVTRVVSITYSEKDVVVVDGVPSSETTAPSEVSMEQQKEAQQRHELEMARRAASLQQSILFELLSMEEERREMELSKAKEAHDSFLQQALTIPPGTERVRFMQQIDPETQRLLVMHKLWESTLAENGGKPPTMRTSE